MRLIDYLLNLLLMGLALTLMPSSYAQQTELPRWFEVEVLVFKHMRSNDSEELWDKKQTIQLPENLKDIITSTLYPDPQLTNLDQQPEVQAAEDQSTGTNQASDSSLQTPIIFQQTAPNNKPVDDNLTPLVPMTPELKLLDLMQQAEFNTVSDDQLQLGDILSSMNRSSSYKVLSHFAWRQPVKAKSEAEWVRIVGGKEFSDKFDYKGNDNSQEKIISELGISINPFASSDLNANNSVTNPSIINTQSAGSDQDISGEQTDTIANSSDATTQQQVQCTGVDINSPEHSNEQGKAITELCQPDLSIAFKPVPEIDGAIQVYLG
ncbi:MAG: CsiV family protein, partial [Kangiellaceae bacterium]|nr:CsiV family protein [Kangiellaceae bacterium]